MKRTITTPYCLQRPLELNDLFATAASLLSAGNNKDIGRCLKVRRSSGEGRDWKKSEFFKAGVTATPNAESLWRQCSVQRERSKLRFSGSNNLAEELLRWVWWRFGGYKKRTSPSLESYAILSCKISHPLLQHVQVLGKLTAILVDEFTCIFTCTLFLLFFYSFWFWWLWLLAPSQRSRIRSLLNSTSAPTATTHLGTIMALTLTPASAA